MLRVTPAPFYAFRKLLALQMKILFPSNGGDFEEKENSGEQFGNITFLNLPLSDLRLCPVVTKATYRLCAKSLA